MNIIAYIPTLNNRHIEWIKKHKPLWLYLVSNEMAQELVPRLSRNMAFVPTELMAKMLEALGLTNLVRIFNPTSGNPNLQHLGFKEWLLPDEDISHVINDRYLYPEGVKVSFESIWARYDMSAVTSNQPVIADMVVSGDHFDKTRILVAQSFSQKSPDWWRQVGALIVDAGGKPLTAAFNKHMPDEYVTYTFGDPRLYANAGERGKSCAMHAERGAIAECARVGIATEGASIYVTTFPCEDCAREIVVAGIKKVFFRDGYSVLNAMEVLREGRVTIVQVRV